MNKLPKDFKNTLDKLKEVLNNQEVTGFFLVATVKSSQKNSVYFYHASEDYMNLLGFVGTLKTGIEASAYAKVDASDADTVTQEDPIDKVINELKNKRNSKLN